MPRVSLRLSFEDEKAIGPGKVRLLELIAQTGSISAAGRAMTMSYHRAWDLVDELNHTFREPLVSKQPGGANGGGATLTPAGLEVIRRYRSVEAGVSKHSAADLAALERLLPALKPKRKRR